MLATFLTRTWGLEIPVIGAPMSPMSGGRLAAAVSTCGGLGMIGVSSTQPVEQLERDVADCRSLAPGRPFGIASGRGLAAVLAAGAQGAWIGTPLLLAEEARNSDAARRKVIEARETDTLHTRVFDVVQGIPWPPASPGRALANAFTARWHGHEAELAQDPQARQAFQQAKQVEDYSSANLYAGQSVGMAERVEPAAAILGRIVRDAETHLRAAMAVLG